MFSDKKCISCFSGELKTDHTNMVCQKCSLTFAYDLGVANYSDEYVANASLYGSHFQVLDSFQTTNDIESVLLPFEKKIISLLKKKQVSSLVDLGCGIGRFLRASELVTGDSIGFEVVNQICERLEKHGRRAVRGGIEDFLKSDLKPEAISMLEVVEHLRNPGELINRVYQEKAPRLLIVVVPDSNTRRSFDQVFQEHDVPPNHLSWWSPQALQELLKHDKYTVTVEGSVESRRSLVHLALRKGHLKRTGAIKWAKSLMMPPTFWFLGVAEKK